MSMVLAKCKICGQQSYVPQFQLGGEGCHECLSRMGKKFSSTPNRGLLKRKRIGQKKAARLASNLAVTR